MALPLIVRNAFDHDSRVLRAANTLQSLGFETTVLAVVSLTERRQLTDQDGIQVRRIGPTSRLAWFVYRNMFRTLAPISARAARAEPREALAGARKAAAAPIHALGFDARLLPARASLRCGGLAPDLVHCNDYNTMWIGVLRPMALPAASVIYDSHELWPDRNRRPEPRWWLLLCERFFVRLVDP